MLDLLIIQLTPFCNINCSYCYLHDRNNNKIINLATIDLIIERLRESKSLIKKSFTVVFHSGEPLVVSPQFMEAVIVRFNQGLPDVTINYSIQTNATLLTQIWCDLIKKYNINIGVSVDGPQFINDEYRKTRSGRGTYDKIMNGLDLLQKNEISFHGIAVITEKSLNYPKEIFDFFYDNGFSQLGLNIEETEGVHQNSSVLKNEVKEQVLAFYEKFYILYLQSDKKLKIREFERALNMILRNPNVLDIKLLELGSHQVTPFAIITVDYKGNFSTFSPELIGQKSEQYNDFILGNVHINSFLDPEYKTILNRLDLAIKKGIKFCKKECEYFNVCGGGAPANKFYENKKFESSETNYCRFNIKVPTDLVLANLEKSLIINKQHQF